jgi:beta-lactamase class A
VAAVLVAGATTGASSGGVGSSGDMALRRALDRFLPAAQAAGRAADHGRGSPDQIQAQYDAARDLQEGLAAAGPVSDGCQRLLAAALDLAGGEIDEAEGVDRPSRPLLTAGTGLIARATAQLAQLSRTCSKGPVRGAGQHLPEPLSPASGEAFFDWIRARAPVGANRVEVAVDGATTRRLRITSRSVAIRTGAGPGEHDVQLRFLRGARVVGTVAANGVWLLPSSSGVATPAASRDRRLDAQAAALANGFDGTSAIWVENLRTGRYGGWNTDARFPAASTVKLGVLVAALARFGPRPERSPAAYDLRTLAAWSSNLAANRLARVLGGAAAVQAVLVRLGATSSTYPGDYRVGTALHAAHGDAPDPPPVVSGRVTTAHDLATVLFELQAAAVGKPSALAATRLTVHEARVGLGLLLDSQPIGDNLGLFRPWTSPAFPMAQKQGWLHDARHTAAILYFAGGPSIAVLLTYRPGITRPEAAKLGRGVVRLSLSS